MKKASAIKNPEGDGVAFEAVEVIERLKQHLNIRTNAALSDILNVRPNTISTWKKRNTLDFPRVFAPCKTYNIDIGALFFNQASRRTSTLEKNGDSGFCVVSRNFTFRYVIECHLKSFIDSLPKFNFPFIKGDNIRAFQMVGSSMAPELQDGDFVVGEYRDIDISKLSEESIYVLVSKIRGIYISRIFKNPLAPNHIVLNMNDKLAKGQDKVKMHSEELLEIWEVISVFSLDLIGHRGTKNP
ncbi:LexA family transcriptional regulator [Sinomicrobium sp.]